MKINYKGIRKFLRVATLATLIWGLFDLSENMFFQSGKMQQQVQPAVDTTISYGPYTNTGKIKSLDEALNVITDLQKSIDSLTDSLYVLNQQQEVVVEKDAVKSIIPEFSSWKGIYVGPKDGLYTDLQIENRDFFIWEDTDFLGFVDNLYLERPAGLRKYLICFDVREKDRSPAQTISNYQITVNVKNNKPVEVLTDVYGRAYIFVDELSSIENINMRATKKTQDSHIKNWSGTDIPDWERIYTTMLDYNGYNNPSNIGDYSLRGDDGISSKPVLKYNRGEVRQVRFNSLPDRLTNACDRKEIAEAIRKKDVSGLTQPVPPDSLGINGTYYFLRIVVEVGETGY